MHLRRDSNDTASSSSNSFSLSMQAHLAGLVWPPVAVIGTLSTRGLLFLQISTVILKIVQGKKTKYSHQFLQGTVHQGIAVPSDFHRNLENSSGQKYKIFPPVPPLKGSFSMSGIDKKGGGAREIKLRGESQGCSFPVGRDDFYGMFRRTPI